MIDMATYMAERRKNRQTLLRAQLGNHCVICGSQDELEFDHIDPATKRFQISGRGLDQSWTRLQEELGKCQLLCKLHHVEKTNKDRRAQYRHGTNSMYVKMKCRCDPCRNAMTAYRRSLKVQRG